MKLYVNIKIDISILKIPIGIIFLIINLEIFYAENFYFDSKNCYCNSLFNYLYLKKSFELKINISILNF
jgi:hypothetical protein